MQREVGVMTVVQEGRFRVSTDDGRSQLFTLDHRAALEPQELPALLTRRVEVVCSAAPGRNALVACSVTPADMP